MLDLQLIVIDIRNARHVKKISKELMPVGWYITTLRKLHMSEDDRKEIQPFLVDEK